MISGNVWHMYLKDGISLPFTISVGDDLGFANWPAILAILTTGNLAPTISHLPLQNTNPKSKPDSSVKEPWSWPQLDPTSLALVPTSNILSTNRQMPQHSLRHVTETSDSVLLSSTPLVICVSILNSARPRDIPRVQLLKAEVFRACQVLFGALLYLHRQAVV